MASLFGCRTGPEGEGQTVIALVDGRPIDSSWFERSYVAFLMASGQNDTEAQRWAHLDHLVDVLILEQEAKARKLDEDSTFVAFKRREEKKAAGTLFFHDAFVKTLPAPTEQEIRLAFARSRSQVVVRHLFFRSEETAKASYDRLEAGRPFLEEAADVYGLAEVDSAAGLLGPIKYYSVDDAVAEAAFSLTEGTYSLPVRSRFGWHIIRSERIIVNPLLTEDEFQVRKGGISSQFRLRRRRLEGDRFVQSFMEGLSVTANPGAIPAMATLIDDIANKVDPQPEVIQAGELRMRTIDSLRAMLSPGTPLLTYTYRGRERVYTAGEYASWLDELPFAEARFRTAISVGRALRNDVFAMEGERLGLIDEAADRLVNEAVAVRLADEMRRIARQSTWIPPDSLVDRAISRLGLDKRRLFDVAYEIVPAESRDMAEAVRARAAAQESSLTSEVGYRRVGSATTTNMAPWLRITERLPIGEPAVVVMDDGNWAVLRVTTRVPYDPGDAAHIERLRTATLPLVREFSMLRDLRHTAKVSVDTTAFLKMTEGF